MILILNFSYIFQAIEQMVSGFLIHLQKWTAKYCPITHFSIYKRLASEKEWMIGTRVLNFYFRHYDGSIIQF